MSDGGRDDMRRSDVSGRLQLGRLLGVSLAMLSAHRRTVLGVWGLFTAVNIAVMLASPDGTSAFTPLSLMESVLIAAISLGLVRSLTDVTPAWRLGPRGVIFIAMDFASSMGLGLWYEAGDMVNRVAGRLSPDAALFGATVGLAFLAVVGLAVWAVFVGLALWTYGHAFDAPRISIRDSFRGARGAVGAVIGATAVLAVLPTEGALLLMNEAGLGQAGGLGWWVYIGLEAGLLAWFSTGVVTVPAALYRLRRGRRGSAVAEVFD
jgi:hypothetical protein